MQQTWILAKYNIGILFGQSRSAGHSDYRHLHRLQWRRPMAIIIVRLGNVHHEMRRNQRFRLGRRCFRESRRWWKSRRADCSLPPPKHEKAIQIRTQSSAPPHLFQNACTSVHSKSYKFRISTSNNSSTVLPTPPVCYSDIVRQQWHLSSTWPLHSTARWLLWHRQVLATSNIGIHVSQ